MKMFLQALTVFLVAHFVAADLDDSCQTPDGKSGHCKLIHRCDYLKLKPVTGEYVREASCGLGKYHMVCCQDPSTDFIINNLFPNKEVCGFVAKNKTEGDDLPWLVGLMYTTRRNDLLMSCLGALINERYVLTSRHCAIQKIKSVRLGNFHSRKGSVCGNEKCFDALVEDIKIYETNDSKQNDIALLRLKEKVTFSDYIKPICLPTTIDDIRKSYLGLKLTLATFRAPKKDKDYFKTTLDLPVRELEYCNYSVPLHSGHLCVGGEEGKDACDGDAGGPLMAKKNENGLDQWYAAGVVSFGPVPCGRKDKPSVYTKITKYITWISDNLKP